MFVESVSELEAVYGKPKGASLTKVADHLTDEYGRWIMESRYCILTTVGPEGTDCSPRGDDGPVVRMLDERTLALPDWAGNNRIDSLRNIVRDGRVSLMFMVPGSANVVRVNGKAWVSLDDELTRTFENTGKHPRSVTVISVKEIYFQCARAIYRSNLWDSKQDVANLPTAGEMIAAMTESREGGTEYDRTWPGRAKKTMW